eukprot:TRINITY_DN25770_c0_g1_i3.p1 TRINITY_DN25770_c0_g1~~TRINITY_DN25770_c0_g1_i3.p1  ORF type:complete len:197 (+),score=52.63 TRINITY_DN25770_c0_g1_i3:41-631(+)
MATLRSLGLLLVVALVCGAQLPGDGKCHDDSEYKQVYENLLGLDVSKRAGFLEKALGCLAEGGILAVAMVHDAGAQHDFIRQFNFKNTTAGEVRAYFEAQSIPYESVVNPTTLVWDSPSVAERFEKAFAAIYFFVVEDALTREDYRSMDVVQAKHFEKKLRDYTWSLMDEATGQFSLTMLDEYIFVRKQPSARKEM